MDRFDRIFDLHKLLSAARQPVSRQRIEQELECSRATAKRIIEAMRLYLNAPIVYDRERNGYYYDTRHEAMYELPGVWFNASELHALLSVQQLLGEIQPGLLEKQLAPLAKRIQSLLSVHDSSHTDLARRIRIVHAAAREPGDAFRVVADALARRRRLAIDYRNRARGSITSRVVSPQRLVHYRNNWYLDAYCHLRAGLRTFSVDAICRASIDATAAEEIDEETLNTHHGSAYGIFSGAADKQAELIFSPTAAAWVAQERWHPEQQGCWQEDGSYRLRIPYSNSTELVMDILKYGAEVRVAGPQSLVEAVTQQLRSACALYTNPETHD